MITTAETKIIANDVNETFKRIEDNADAMKKVDAGSLVRYSLTEGKRVDFFFLENSESRRQRLSTKQGVDCIEKYDMAIKDDIYSEKEETGTRYRVHGYGEAVLIIVIE